MDTPIYDFVQSYIRKNSVRLHMPGHKGAEFLGCEKSDITEIPGADSLYEAEGIIRKSELNAGELFGCDTYYSTEGSSHCIRTMMFLVRQYAYKMNRKPIVLAGRNAHKTFLSAVSLTDVEVEWIYTAESSYLSCSINSSELDTAIVEMEVKPVAVYLTSPDYLGNVLDIKSIAEVCHKHNVLLLVDNAHGAYLKFLRESQHPVDLGADMCCDSAHKTLPVLTGGAYLHLSDEFSSFLGNRVRDALSLFGSTSPSYLILQSLDLANKYISEGFNDSIVELTGKIYTLKNYLIDKGMNLIGSDPLKLAISTKSYGYTGYEFAELLRSKNIECEFADNDFVVLMFTTANTDDDFVLLEKAFSEIDRLPAITKTYPEFSVPEKVMTVKEAMFSLAEIVSVDEAQGRVIASACVSCPPAVAILMPGEFVTDTAIQAFKYYGINKITVVK